MGNPGTVLLCQGTGLKQYRNTKTGVVIIVDSEIAGDWELIPSPVSSEEKAKTEEKPKKTTRKKK